MSQVVFSSCKDSTNVPNPLDDDYGDYVIIDSVADELLEEQRRVERNRKVRCEAIVYKLQVPTEASHVKLSVV